MLHTQPMHATHTASLSPFSNHYSNNTFLKINKTFTKHYQNHIVALLSTYALPVVEAVEEHLPTGLNIWAPGVDQHGDGGTHVAPRPALGVSLVEPDAHWDIICVTCLEDELGSLQ